MSSAVSDVVAVGIDRRQFEPSRKSDDRFAVTSRLARRSEDHSAIRIARE